MLSFGFDEVEVVGFLNLDKNKIPSVGILERLYSKPNLLLYLTPHLRNLVAISHLSLTRLP